MLVAVRKAVTCLPAPWANLRRTFLSLSFSDGSERFSPSGSQAVKQSSSQAVKQSSSQAVKQPSRQAAKPSSKGRVRCAAPKQRRALDLSGPFQKTPPDERERCDVDARGHTRYSVPTLPFGPFSSDARRPLRLPNARPRARQNGAVHESAPPLRKRVTSRLR
jgi:hypothetical protein